MLEGFEFTMLVGIISGTSSTIFIAAAIAIMMSRAGSGAAAAPAAAAPSSSSSAGTSRAGGSKKGSARKASAR